MLPRVLVLCATLLLAACASYDGRGLTVGVAGFDEVRTTMGEPALQWRDPDGSRQLAYPRGPAGFDTFMVRLGPDGRLRSIESVLDEPHLATLRAGMSREQVLRVLGPPDKNRTVYFAARDELVWDWRYRNVVGKPWRMLVLFDASSGTLRGTMVQPEQWVSDLAVP